jgi:hypothetical protein
VFYWEDVSIFDVYLVPNKMQKSGQFPDEPVRIKVGQIHHLICLTTSNVGYFASLFGQKNNFRKKKRFFSILLPGRKEIFESLPEESEESTDGMGQ